MNLSAIVISVITGTLALIGTYISTKANSENIMRDFLHELEKRDILQDERILNLTKEVREHNHFAQRIPVLEQRIKNVEKEVFNK